MTVSVGSAIRCVRIGVNNDGKSEMLRAWRLGPLQTKICGISNGFNSLCEVVQKQQYNRDRRFTMMAL